MDKNQRNELVERALVASAEIRTAQPELAATIDELSTAIIEAHAANLVTLQHLRVARNNEDCMSGAAVHAVRRLLEANHVPPATFIDDHVGNVVVQRNKLLMCMRNIVDRIGIGDVSLIDIKQLIADGEVEAKIDQKVLMNVPEESQKNTQAA